MIIRASQASSDLLKRTAELVATDATYVKEAFPECTNKTELFSQLQENPESWHILYSDMPEALFALQLSDGNAVIENPSHTIPNVLDRLVANLQHDLRKSKTQFITLRVPEQAVDLLRKKGFEKQRMIVKFMAPVVETELMPVLPLANPTERDISALAKLMHESYQKSGEPVVANVSAAEGALRSIMRGSQGVYDAAASLMSGVAQNIVSACFIALRSSLQARVVEVFTHPLYRARGLATIEIATAMNRLLEHGVQSLTVQLSERNEIATRLFAKLGFEKGETLTEMKGSIQ
jgi:predicted GNAT family acetyltransferase